MARLNRRIETDEVQGPGSYVVIRCLTYGEQDTCSRLIRDLLPRVVEWNWTGEDGEPLPLPADDEAQKRLTDWEAQYLARGILLNVWGEQGKADRKN